MHVKVNGKQYGLVFLQVTAGSQGRGSRAVDAVVRDQHVDIVDLVRDVRGKQLQVRFKREVADEGDDITIIPFI